MSSPAPSSVGQPRVTSLLTTTTTRSLQLLRFWAYSESPYVESISKEDVQLARNVLQQQLGEDDLPAPPSFAPVAPGRVEDMSWPAKWETNRMSLVFTLRWLARKSKETVGLDADVDVDARDH